MLQKQEETCLTEIYKSSDYRFTNKHNRDSQSSIGNMTQALLKNVSDQGTRRKTGSDKQQVSNNLLLFRIQDIISL